MTELAKIPTTELLDELVTCVAHVALIDSLVQIAPCRQVAKSRETCLRVIAAVRDEIERRARGE